MDWSAAAERSVRFSSRLFTCSVMRCSFFVSCDAASDEVSVFAALELKPLAIAKSHPSLDREIDLIHEAPNDLPKRHGEDRR